ncbi:MAG: hypothetical protein H6599_03795 [Flavobacteriales bacterium]|nr:hypothetical protein [Flavobacteriales bacterium]
MRYITILLVLWLGTEALAQKDWELPMKGDKVSFTFKSKTMSLGGKDLCDIYYSPQTTGDLMAKTISHATSGKVKLLSASTFMFQHTLHSADGKPTSLADCKPNQPDTAYGTLSFNLTQVNALGKGRSGTIKCIFRIVLMDDGYEIQFRGFKYTFFKSAGFGKPQEQVTVNLEEEYDPANASSSDKKYWADVKMLVELFHMDIEDVLSSQIADFSFDD